MKTETVHPAAAAGFRSPIRWIEIGAGLAFDLPRELEAGEPPEARGLPRDDVRLMVSYSADDRVLHARFTDLPEFLAAGDLVVLNTSGTRDAAIAATRRDGTRDAATARRSHRHAARTLCA
jgi:S-adenosylmethionine:tRNA-ribosyltransferase-isomerase (queuine synthetase)